MQSWSVARWTGALGLGGTVLQLLGFALFFAAGVPPGLSQQDKLLSYVRDGRGVLTTAVLLFLLGFTLLLGFQAGFRSLVATAAPHFEWLGTTALAAGVATLVMGVVGIGIALTAGVEAGSSSPQAASVRTLFEAGAVLAGAPTLVPVAFYLGAVGSAGFMSRLLPLWLALVGSAGSILVLIASLSAYGSNDVSAFWAANGLVTILALLPLYVWTLGASVMFLRKPA